MPSNKVNDDIIEIWRRVSDILRAELGQRLFAVYIAPLRVTSADAERVALACGSATLRDTVAERFGVRIANLIAKYSGFERAIDFVFEPTPHLVVVSAPKEAGVSSFDARFAALQTIAARRREAQPDFAAGDDVLRMIAARIPKEAAVLEQALQRVAQCSAAAGEPITFANAQVWLSDFLRAHDRRVTVDAVKRCVSRRYGLKPGELESKCRRSEVVRPRQLAFYTARVLTGKSFPDIGRHFSRDHTTVLYGYEKILNLKETNQEIAAELDAIKRDLRDWSAEPE
jgi:chromosomal replication initiation ATPase DnaA